MKIALTISVFCLVTISLGSGQVSTVQTEDCFEQQTSTTLYAIRKKFIADSTFFSLRKAKNQTIIDKNVYKLAKALQKKDDVKYVVVVGKPRPVLVSVIKQEVITSEDNEHFFDSSCIRLVYVPVILHDTIYKTRRFSFFDIFGKRKNNKP